ncbi:Putative alpha/Beta hydrolase [Colletotrichum destructivum]|uniref:Alpha/Beta hydrolase n=1 Tax=Colletotrichum destructivum TaxID=34406 RepID=A0AAX4HWW3_9PEZI|nr:Putative alpha/Beta hydrolase [Colletotrichum destructivum]
MLAPGSPYQILDQENLTQAEVELVQRMYDFSVTGSSSILEQCLRLSTICFVLLSSSLAKLARYMSRKQATSFAVVRAAMTDMAVRPRIGEKFFEWTDSRCPLPLDTALALVGFHWYTNAYPRSLYLYHYITEAAASDVLFAVPISREKPFGYSVFPAENILVPKAWARQVYPNLAFYERNEKVKQACLVLPGSPQDQATFSPCCLLMFANQQSAATRVGTLQPSNNTNSFLQNID